MSHTLLNKPKWLTWVLEHPGKFTLYCLIGVLALLQAIGSGASNAFYLLKSLPSISSMSLLSAKVMVTSLCGLGMAMNLYAMCKLLPSAAHSIYEFLSPKKRTAAQRGQSLNKHNNLFEMWHGLQFENDVWQQSKGAYPRLRTIGFSLLLILALLLSISAGIGIGALVIDGFPAAFYSINALHSMSFPLASWIPFTLGIIQGMTVAALLFKSALRCLMAVSLEGIKNFLCGKWWPTTDRITHQLDNRSENQNEVEAVFQKKCLDGKCHCLAKARVHTVVKAFVLITAAVTLVYAAIANVIVEGSASTKIFENLFKLTTKQSELLTNVIIYAAGGLLSVILSLDTANAIFKPIGHRIGEFVSAPLDSINKLGQSARKAVKKLVNYAKAHPVKFSLFAFLAVGYVASFIGNTIINFATSSFGVNHPEEEKSSYAMMGDKIKQCASVSEGMSTLSADKVSTLHQLIQTPQASMMEKEHLYAGLAGGFVSASTIAYMSFAFNQKKRPYDALPNASLSEADTLSNEIDIEIDNREAIKFNSAM